MPETERDDKSGSAGRGCRQGTPCRRGAAPHAARKPMVGIDDGHVTAGFAAELVPTAALTATILGSVLPAASGHCSAHIDGSVTASVGSRSNVTATRGKTTTDNKPADTNAAPVTGRISPKATPISVAVTRKGNDVA